MALKDIKQFEAWLGLQLGRSDPVGDFATDWLQDVRDGCAVNIFTISSMDRHIKDEHPDAIDGVFAARDRAWREYAEALRQPPMLGG